MTEESSQKNAQNIENMTHRTHKIFTTHNLHSPSSSAMDSNRLITDVAFSNPPSPAFECGAVQ